MQITLEGHAPVAARAGESLLDALLRAGLPFPFACQSGTCGTCKCELVSGRVEQLEYSVHALPAAERARGRVLACRCLVHSDIVIRL